MEITPKEFFNLQPDSSKDDLWEALNISKEDIDKLNDLTEEAANKYDKVSSQLKYIIDNGDKKQMLIMMACAHIEMLKMEGAEFEDKDEDDNIQFLNT